jgi:NADPH2:quinone reductase
MPEGMDFPVAATLGLAYGTSYYGLLERGRLRQGETLLVLGASGGVGLAAIEIGKIVGARVIACAAGEAKLAVCREHGADETIDYATEDVRSRVKAITGGKGVDVVYDPVGGPFTEPAVRDMAWGGRLLVVGFAAGEIPKIALNLPLIKGCSIVGVWWGAFAKRDWPQHQANVAQLGRWYREGRIKPRIHAAYPLERAADALHALARREVTGKVVLTTRTSPPQ